MSDLTPQAWEKMSPRLRAKVLERVLAQELKVEQMTASEAYRLSRSGAPVALLRIQRPPQEIAGTQLQLHVINAVAQDLAVKLMVKLREEWIGRVVGGTVPGWPPLSPTTVKRKARRSSPNAHIPLVDRGQFLEFLAQWPIKVTSVQETHSEWLIAVGLAPDPKHPLAEAGTDPTKWRGIVRDMLGGAPRRGRRKSEVPARPLPMIESVRRSAEEELQAQFTGERVSLVAQMIGPNKALWT